jgi:methionyl-tRNA synthetase
LSAELAKRSPQEHVDAFHAINQRLFHKLHISFDHFSRTTWPGHVATTYQYFQDLLSNGYIEVKESEQLYSEEDSKFLADRYVVGTCPRCSFESARGDECTRCGASFEATDLKNPRSKLTGAVLVPKKTTHWYLRLDLFKEKLHRWLETKQWKPNVLNFIQSYIQELRPRAITRDTSWGIPVPLQEERAQGKVLYVWFDAPIGYISATKEWAKLQGAPERWRDYWCDPQTRLVQFLGKDNISFHAVIFPAMTMGQNQPYKLVDDMPANEFLNLEGRQFSKSDGWFIDVEEFLTRYSADQIRYTIAANAPETADAEFTWREFQLHCNSDLVGKYGNFIHRTLVFIKNNLGDRLPAMGTLATIDTQFLRDMQRIVDEIAANYRSFKLRRASQCVMELAHLGNVYFDAKHPWKDAKVEAMRPVMETTLFCCLECVKLLALTASPIMPEAAEVIWSMLGLNKRGRLESQRWAEVVSLPQQGMNIGEPKTLFRKIEDSEIEMELGTLQKGQPITQEKKKETEGEKERMVEVEKPALAIKPQVTIDDVRKIDLRIAKICSAEAVPKSKKLLRLVVDVGGGEQRTIVAGIATHFAPEILVGKSVVIVLNLQPAKVMGIESQGMLLIAGSDTVLELLEVETLPPGSTIS